MRKWLLLNKKKKPEDFAAAQYTHSIRNEKPAKADAYI